MRGALRPDRLGTSFCALLLLPVVWQKPAPAKEDPEVPKLCQKLGDVAKTKKGARDTEGIGLLDQLARRFEKVPKKQRKLIVKAVSGVFKAKRSPDEASLLIHAAEALSRMEKDGAAALAKQVENRAYRKKDWRLFRSQLVYLLGRPAEPAQQKRLLDLATRDKDNMVRAKAGEALGFYAKHPQKTRKEVAKKLIIELSAIYSIANRNLDPTDQSRKIYEDLYNAVQDPWIKTLTKLTGQKIKDPIKWENWYNNNKGKNWDKKGFRGTTVAADGGRGRS